MFAKQCILIPSKKSNATCKKKILVLFADIYHLVSVYFFIYFVVETGNVHSLHVLSSFQYAGKGVYRWYSLCFMFYFFFRSNLSLHRSHAC